MKQFLNVLKIVCINLVVLIAILAGLEIYFRYVQKAPQDDSTTGVWQIFKSYTMFMTAPRVYDSWYNSFTSEVYKAHVVTNSIGFNDPHEFDYTKPYEKTAGERVVLFTGGSVAWGFGATATDKTTAGRMQYYLNNLQSRTKYTVINLAMGSWIAFQELLGLELWGEFFSPDWIVTMDGFNDAGVGCAYSQGVGNPMYYSAAKSYIDGYLYTTQHPVFYRGWLENEIIKYSAAYRSLTGKQFVEQDQNFDDTSNETIPARRQIQPTKIGASRDILAFYVKAIRAMLRLFPKTNFILTTQPTVNQFTGDFVDIYKYPPDSEAHRQAMAKREKDLDVYLDAYASEWCNQKSFQPSFTYIFGTGAIQVERLADSEPKDRRQVEYYNLGQLFPDDRSARIPYFTDPAHMNDKGYDVTGRFLAERILAADSATPPTTTR